MRSIMALAIGMLHGVAGPGGLSLSLSRARARISLSFYLWLCLYYTVAA
jgi:hypothetical protein